MLQQRYVCVRPTERGDSAQPERTHNLTVTNLTTSRVWYLMAPAPMVKYRVATMKLSHALAIAALLGLAALAAAEVSKPLPAT